MYFKIKNILKNNHITLKKHDKKNNYKSVSI
jgi:hypothetical protein